MNVFVMAGHWQLPADVLLAMSAHHQVILQGYPTSFAATACLADELAHELGFSVAPESRRRPRFG